MSLDPIRRLAYAIWAWNEQDAAHIRDLYIQRRRLQLDGERAARLLADSEHMGAIDRYLWLCRHGFYEETK